MCDRYDAGIEEFLRPSELIGLDWIGLDWIGWACQHQLILVRVRDKVSIIPMVSSPLF